MSILAEMTRHAARRARSFRGQLNAALVRPLLNTLLPQDCLLCAAPSGSQLICPACAAELPALPTASCPRCALPSPQGETCGRCQRHPPHFDQLIALYPYSFPIDRMIQRLKYGHQLALAEWLGQQLALAARAIPGDLIVPMPLHPTRLAERGFNQAMEICRPLAYATNLPIDSAGCTRIRPTSPQEGLSLLARRRNLKNAFACNADLSGRRILLVDDVVTTGASVGECARILRLHGAAEITVLAVARTLLG